MKTVKHESSSKNTEKTALWSRKQKMQPEEKLSWIYFFNREELIENVVIIQSYLHYSPYVSDWKEGNPFEWRNWRNMSQQRKYMRRTRKCLCKAVNPALQSCRKQSVQSSRNTQRVVLHIADAWHITDELILEVTNYLLSSFSPELFFSCSLQHCVTMGK